MAIRDHGERFGNRRTNAQTTSRTVAATTKKGHNEPAGISPDDLVAFATQSLTF
jgi:hypothetical protein